jgi:hypothetical protein
MPLTPPCMITSGKSFEVMGQSYEVAAGDIVRNPSFVALAQANGATLEQITEGVATAVTGRPALRARVW